MHFLRACRSHKAHNLLARGSAHDGIINHDDSFAFKNGALRIQFNFHTETSNRLTRLNESSSDVMVTNDPEFKWNSTFARISNCRGNSAVGHWNDNVGFDGAFFRENLTHA